MFAANLRTLQNMHQIAPGRSCRYIEIKSKLTERRITMTTEIIQKEEQLDNGWTVWIVEGRIDAVTSDTAYAKGEEILERAEKLVLDMRKVSYLSSAGLRVLVRLFKKAKKQEKEFTVAGATDMVKMVLEDSNLAIVLEARDSLADL